MATRLKPSGFLSMLALAATSALVLAQQGQSPSTEAKQHYANGVRRKGESARAAEMLEW